MRRCTGVWPRAGWACRHRDGCAGLQAKGGRDRQGSARQRGALALDAEREACVEMDGDGAVERAQVVAGRDGRGSAREKGTAAV
jgi:hypothetical protein